MDYTLSNSFVTDAGTGNRMHLEAQAVPTAVSDIDVNGVTWELLSVIKAAGIVPATFDKTNSATYTQVYQALQTLIAAAIAGNAANDYKASVRFTTTGNIVLSGLGTQAGGDWGAALTAGDRIFPQLQTAGADRTIWIAAAGVWTRATDADGVGELTPAAQVTVEEGTTLADSTWELQTDGPITPGVTPLTWARKDGTTGKQIQTIPTPTLASNALTIPAASFTLDFRSATLGSGAVSTVSGTAASLTAPAGASFGIPSGVAGCLALLELNNGGVLEHVLVNAAGTVDIGESGVISTTAISAGATSANVAYSNVARTNAPYRLVGAYISTQTAAGQWATAMTLVQGIGGVALLNLVTGFGKTPTNYTVGTQRVAGTTYYNASSAWKWVTAVATNGSGQVWESRINGALIDTSYWDSNSTGYMKFPVPPWGSYSVNLVSGSGTLAAWREM